MKALYLIFSHEHQEQLVRLVSAIRKLSPKAEIAIHYDPSKSILDTSIFPSELEVHNIPNPVAGEWGDFSLVEQYLRALSWSIDNLNFDWVFTLTGLTYPIKCLRDFEYYVQKSGYDAFIHYFDALDPGHWPEGTGITRYYFKYYKLPRLAYYYKVPTQIRNILESYRKDINKRSKLFRIIPGLGGGQTRLGIRRINIPFHEKSKVYGGRQALNINRKALMHVFDFITKNPWWITYCRRCFIPDEMFFNTILANDPRLKIANNALRFIKWPQKHASSAAVITAEEIPQVLQSDAPFALKLDSRVDSRALDLIDIYLKSCC